MYLFENENTIMNLQVHHHLTVKTLANLGPTPASVYHLGAMNKDGN